MLESARFHFTHRLKNGDTWSVEIDPPRVTCMAGVSVQSTSVIFEHVSAILAHDETARVRATYLVDLLQQSTPFPFPSGLRQKLLSGLAAWIRAHYPIVAPFPGRRGGASLTQHRHVVRISKRT
jgi:hypothetical protein